MTLRPLGSLPARPTISRRGVASGTSAMPSVPGPRTCTRIVPGLPVPPTAVKAAGPFRTIHGVAASVCTFWTTVGMSNRPRSGRVRRTLLRLAAPPLEGLQQDRLLPEHVGALDRPDLNVDVVAGAVHVPTEQAGSAAAMAASRRRTASACSPRTAMNASVAPIA